MPAEKMELDLTEVKAELRRWLSQELQSQRSELQSLRSELSRLSQSQERNHTGYMTMDFWNKNAANIIKRLERLERGDS